MGILSTILDAFACRSECSLNEEAREFKKFLKKLAADDMKELVEYYEAREKHIFEKKKEFRKSVQFRISQI